MIDKQLLALLVPKLKASIYKPEAKVGYEMMSDSLLWEDEIVAELPECGVFSLRALFRYRTSLITSMRDERFKDVWISVKEMCPEWIGFRNDRASFNEKLKRYYLEESNKVLNEGFGPGLSLDAGQS